MKIEELAFVHTGELDVTGDAPRFTYSEFVEFLDRCGMEIRIKEVMKDRPDLL